MYYGLVMDRNNFINLINNRFKTFKVLGILGPRQCGKTTLARHYIEKIGGINPENYFDLEDPLSISRLENPMLSLMSLKGLIVIDEIQRMPNLFPILRVLADDHLQKREFLVLGSASRELIRQGSETLAGRIDYIELTPFSLSEVGLENINKLWLRGGFPIPFLADSDADSKIWLKSYTNTFLERDLLLFGFNIQPQVMRRFWVMLTHYHGQTMNYSEIASSIGLDDKTVRRYVDILEGTFMIRVLRPWSSNLKKRETKSPKIYFRDTGILHSLMGIGSESELLTNPKLGASWEGFALETIIKKLNVDTHDCYFWGVHQQGELDLLVVKDGKLIGFEIKYSDKPSLSKFAKTIPLLLNLDEFNVVYPGNIKFPLTNEINAVGINSFITAPVQNV